MMRWNALVVASVVCAAVLAACTPPQKANDLNPPDLMAQLSNADLKPPPAHPGGPRIEYSSASPPGSGAETFPGTDEVLAARRKRALPAQGMVAGNSGYELNFADAELSELAKVILKDTLGKTYVFDPRVQGRVTISTGGPVSREELIALLESVLAMHRAALVVDPNLYRIVPEAEARQRVTLAIDYNGERKEIGAGYGVAILPLRYISAETMTRMLSSLSNQDPARASLYNNLLIVRGTEEHRNAVLDLASMFDVDWMRGQSAGIYTLKNSAPDEIIKELHTVFQDENHGKGVVRFQAINRLNAVLALTTNSDLLGDIETWVGRLDRGGAEGDNFYVYRVENGRAKDLAALIMAAFNGGSVRGAEEAEVAPTSAVARISTSTNGSGGGEGGFGEGLGESGSSSSPSPSPLSSSTSSSSSSSTSDPAKQSSEPAGITASVSTGSFAGGATGGSEQVRIIPDERNNKLLIKASGRNLRRILSILRRVDQPPLQVAINATLAEVVLNDNLKYGVQFFLQKNGGKSGALGFTNGLDIDIAPAVPGLNFIIGSLVQPKVILDALATQTAVRVVSSPSVVVLHNQTATLQVGDEVPITTRQAVSVINPDSPVVNEIQFKNTGVILKVTPRINTNGLVTMEIQQEISAVSRTTTSDTLTPTISQRRISSTIAVSSGQLVVLGGLISEQNDRQKSSIPFFGKIPYIGDVIGGATDTAKTRTELVVFLQPTVIRDPQDASRVTEEVRASMQSLAPRPAAWDAPGMWDGDVKSSATTVK
jgi:general secretion pathway protein D